MEHSKTQFLYIGCSVAVQDLYDYKTDPRKKYQRTSSAGGGNEFATNLIAMVGYWTCFRQVREWTTAVWPSPSILHFRPRTGFTKENLEWLEQLFRGQLKNSQELHLDDFTKIVHSKNVSWSIQCSMLHLSRPEVFLCVSMLPVMHVTYLWTILMSL